MWLVKLSLKKSYKTRKKTLPSACRGLLTLTGFYLHRYFDSTVVYFSYFKEWERVYIQYGLILIDVDKLPLKKNINLQCMCAKYIASSTPLLMQRCLLRCVVNSWPKLIYPLQWYNDSPVNNSKKFKIVMLIRPWKMFLNFNFNFTIKWRKLWIIEFGCLKV